MSVYSIVQELRSTTSKLEKESILRREINNTDLQTFFRLSLNRFINFYQKKPITVDIHTGIKPLSFGMEWLEGFIAGRKITGNAARSCIGDIMKLMSTEDAAVLQMILAKNPDCGVDTLAEKIWPGTNPEYPVALATAFDQKLFDKYFAKEKSYLCQLKSDGARCNILINNGVVTVFTRSGRQLDVNGAFDCLSGFNNGSWIIDGELLCVDPDTGKFLNRQTGNGIISRAVKGTLPEGDEKFLHLVAWDIIPFDEFNRGKGTEPYRDRIQLLTELIEANTHKNKISLIPSKVIHSLEEANTFFNEMLEAGEEGAMLKRMDEVWESKRSKSVLKMKAINTAELRIVGYTEGTGKLTDNLGALSMITDDAKVSVNMSGFDLKTRSEIYANLIDKPVEYQMMTKDGWFTFVAKPGDCDIKLGSIVEVTYNMKIKDRNSVVWSLFLPRFKCARLDKNTTDTLETIK